MNFQNILTAVDGNVLIITINRPKNLNALNKPTIEEISEAINLLHEEDALRGAIIIGSGEKAFVAGADIKEFSSFNLEQGKHLAANGQEILFNKIEESAKPIIACVNGYALGGGCELAMACHMRIASENAMFGLPEVSLGLIPGYGGTQRLPQIVGKGKALEMLMTASMIKADEAYRVGLANYVVTQEELIEKAKSIFKKISKNAPLAVAKTIEAVNAFNKEDEDGFAKEIELFGECFATEDFIEGTTAFVEKRKADFKGK
ncbi:MAG: enoyl-CoA hydratase-related protein [Chitinophagales bacterium]